jgi:hypothetical protein
MSGRPNATIRTTPARPALSFHGMAVKNRKTAAFPARDPALICIEGDPQSRTRQNHPARHTMKRMDSTIVSVLFLMLFVSCYTQKQMIIDADSPSRIDGDKVIRNIDKIKDPALLADIARNAEFDDVRVSAVKNMDTLRFKDVLIEIAKKGGIEGETATQKINDQATLADIVMNTDDPSVKKIGIGKLDSNRWRMLFYDICLNFNELPVYYSGDFGYGQPAVHKLEDQDLLAGLSQHAKNNYVRRDAIEKLDPIRWKELLVQIAGSNADYDVCSAALQRIDDQKSIADFVEKTQSYPLKKEAIARLDADRWEAFLCETAKHEEMYFEVGIDILSRLKNPTTIADIAQNAKSERTREAAVDRLPPDQWQDLLATIALADKANEVRCSAIQKLIPEKWEELFLKLLKNRQNDSSVRVAAIDKLDPVNHQDLFVEMAASGEKAVAEKAAGKITTKTYLYEIVRHHNDENVRMAAWRQIIGLDLLGDLIANDICYIPIELWGDITDQNALIRIAKTDKNKSDRATAAEKITDPGVLADIARTDTDAGVRVGAVQRITDPNMLIDIARRDADAWVCGAAVTRLTDQVPLTDFALHHPFGSVRSIAVEKIKDQNVIDGIAVHDADPTVRRSALDKVDDQNVIRQIAKNDADPSVRLKASRKIQDDAILADLAIHEKDPDVCFSIVSRIGDPKLYGDIVNNPNVIRFVVKPGDYNCDGAFRFLVFAFTHIDADRYHRPFLEALDVNCDRNFSAIIALKAIQGDSILKKYYPKIGITPIRKEIDQKYTIGTWTSIDYTIKTDINGSERTFSYNGERGGGVESGLKIKGGHEGKIDLSDICEYLLKPVRKEDLVRLSAASTINCLREAAGKLLKQ